MTKLEKWELKKFIALENIEIKKDELLRLEKFIDVVNKKIDNINFELKIKHQEDQRKNNKWKNIN